jgi:hypothetical protein
MPTIPYDKALHYVYGSVIFAVCYHLIGVGNSLLAVLLVASGKEVYDYMHRDSHTPDIWDLIATLCGAVVCASVLIGH